MLLADFEDVTGSLERWEDWCAAWSARAPRCMRNWVFCPQREFQAHAGEHLVRAAIYYHFAKFVFVQDPKQMRAAHMKAVECYRDGVAFARPPGSESDSFRRQDDLRSAQACLPKTPVLIMAPGLDSTKEEIHAYEEPFLARGIAVLAIDGPGQGEAEYEIPICGDYERAAKAVVDWIETRDRLSEVCIWGVSLGGYYAPRAAYEKRIKACIALSGPFEWERIWDGLPELTRETFRVRSHSWIRMARRKAAELTMKEAAPRITCPIFIVTGRQDRLVPASHAEQLAKAVSGRSSCSSSRTAGTMRTTALPLPQPHRGLAGGAVRTAENMRRNK